MCVGVRESSCTRCIHGAVCIYKESYLRYLESLMKFNRDYSGDISFIENDNPNCNFFSKKRNSNPGRSGL